MFYVKAIVDGKSVEFDLYHDEIFTKCYICGDEMQADIDLIRGVFVDGGDLSSTSLAHGACVEKTKLQVIDGGKANSPSVRPRTEKANS